MTKKKGTKKKATKAKKSGIIGSQFIASYEEIEIVCSNCAKKFRMIKTPGLSTEGLLCQKCGQGETISDDG